MPADYTRARFAFPNASPHATIPRMTRSLPSLALSLLLVASLHAADGHPEFKPLFNGKDLGGWVPMNVAPSTFTVRDNMIVSTGKPTGIMRTDRQYENYIIELEWKHLTKGGNAGLFLHGWPTTAQGTPFARGIEVQIIDSTHPEGIATAHGDVFAIH